jgi:hypothetical protein
MKRLPEPKSLGNCVARHVVLGRTEPSGHDHNLRTGDGGPYGCGEAEPVVADDRL